MEKSNRSEGEGEDRLSELTDSLIFHIFSFMPMTDVVKTTILSNRWKNLWTTAPTLNFKDFKMESTDDTDLFQNKVRNFINQALKFWRGAKIQVFEIDIGTRLNSSLYSDINLWLEFAKKYEVENLCVYLRSRSFQVPQLLYSCSSLKVLRLIGGRFHVPTTNVNWNKLKHLSIDGYGLSEDLINKVLSGSTNLKFLTLHLVGNRDNLYIFSSSLRRLHIDRSYVKDNPSVDTELRILTPNLKRLAMIGVPYRKCLMNVPSLIHAKLSFSDNDFVGETLRQILPTIRHVQSLALSDWSIKALGAMKNKNMLSPFPNVRLLKLRGCFEEYQQIMHILEIFPKLGRLVLEQRKADRQFQGKESVKFEANLPNSFLQKLRTIVVTWAEGEEDSIFPFIELLLKYARKLKMMVFQVKETASLSNSLLLALLGMPRSCPTAKLVFSKIPGK